MHAGCVNAHAYVRFKLIQADADLAKNHLYLRNTTTVFTEKLTEYCMYILWSNMYTAYAKPTDVVSL